MDTIYQPAVPERYSPEAVAKLSPSDPARTLVGFHAAIGPIAKTIDDARAAIDADQSLSPEGRRAAKEKVFADHVAGTIAKHSQPLKLAALHTDEQSAALLKKAIQSGAVSESRSLALAAWLRDLPSDERSRVVLQAIHDGDPEALASVVNAPAMWRVATPALHERATGALIDAHDPEKAAELRDMKTLIEAVHASHESVARYGRDRLNLRPLPPKAA